MCALVFNKRFNKPDGTNFHKNRSAACPRLVLAVENPKFSISLPNEYPKMCVGFDTH